MTAADSATPSAAARVIVSVHDVLRIASLLSQFVQVVERILKHPPNIAEPGDNRVLAQSVLVQAERAQPGAAIRQRGRQAVQDAHAMKQRSQRTLVSFDRVGAVRLKAHINAAGSEALADRSQQAEWFDRVMDDVECRDDIERAREP